MNIIRQNLNGNNSMNKKKDVQIGVNYNIVDEFWNDKDRDKDKEILDIAKSQRYDINKSTFKNIKNAISKENDVVDNINIQDKHKNKKIARAVHSEEKQMQNAKHYELYGYNSYDSNLENDKMILYSKKTKTLYKKLLEAKSYIKENRKKDSEISLQRCNSLYLKAKIQQNKRNEEINRKKIIDSQNELKNCTFKPKLNRDYRNLSMIKFNEKFNLDNRDNRNNSNSNKPEPSDRSVGSKQNVKTINRSTSELKSSKPEVEFTLYDKYKNVITNSYAQRNKEIYVKKKFEDPLREQFKRLDIKNVLNNQKNEINRDYNLSFINRMERFHMNKNDSKSSIYINGKNCVINPERLLYDGSIYVKQRAKISDDSSLIQVSQSLRRELSNDNI